MSRKHSDLSILIVSDVNSDNQYLAELLKPHVNLVSSVTNIKQALRLLKKLPVDVILISEAHQYQNAAEFTLFNQAVGNCPVLLLIEPTSINQLNSYFDMGIYDVIAKPFHVKTVLNHLACVKLKLEEKVLTKEIDDLNEMAELGNTVAEVIHEVATPISNVQLLVDYLIEQNEAISHTYFNAKLSKKILEQYLTKSKTTLDMSKSNIELASNILFSFKRVSVDQLFGQRISFNLLQYINDILLTLRPKLKKYTHEITLDIADDIMITSIPGVLSQIIINFVNNTLLHAFEDEAKGKIKIKACYVEGILKIIYRDNGIGMDSHTLEQAFDKFYTTKANNGGTGLGLHICKELVEEKLGGTLLLESKLGLGTTFTISIAQQEINKP